MSYRPGTLKLVLGDRSVVLRFFSDGSFPREAINTPSINYSLAGTPLLEGSGREPKHLWDLNVRVTDVELLTLQKIYRQAIASNLPVILHDYIMPFTEAGDRTRAYADEASELLDDDPDMTTYYSRFAVFMTEEPKAKLLGRRLREVVVTLQELEKVPA